MISLRLDNNQLSGSIPSTLGSCAWLQDLHLGNNSLTGTLPSTLGRSSHLQGLHLSSNALRGSIPQDLFLQLLSLVTFNVANNSLTGSLPQLGPCPVLQTLELWNNALNGAPPIVHWTDTPARVCSAFMLYTTACIGLVCGPLP
jgi:Leucine-rich repeat (LRR) protein